MKTIINTREAPKAIGTYSQAVLAGNTLYVSGQIGVDPDSLEMVAGGIEAQCQQVFTNLEAILDAANATLAHCVKFTVYLTDLTHFEKVNKVMAARCELPYPARAAVEVSALPKGALIEIDAIAVL